ncbi:condensin complex subunit SMC2 [Phlegmacium glaucopus]|nr:condensin complex subunit SMC2 [Phlegmacium glaucopus]
MRIEELIIEGFKSYPVRTQITGWDPSFNAITGLNGSGKSNILDAICFVLGITNMSTMRASNQQDLIYKRGQAGVTKASVTIVFDNSDRSKSPTGFENFRQITVTRQIALPNVSKYLLNGHKALQANIQTLFQGVQLNINNPNFVIMQGRITKVLNMRPQEILGMVEEAAGTRMFEEQKDKARKKMGKKEKSVLEYKATLQEEINPKLEKLRNEKRSFIQFQKSVSELERTARILRALEWTTHQDRMHEKEEKIEEKHAEIKQVESEKKQAIKDGEAAEKEVVKVSKKRDAEMSKGGKLKTLQDKASELGKVVAKIRTQAEIKVATIKDEEDKIKTYEARLKELDISLIEKRKDVEKVATAHRKVKDEHTSLETKLGTDEELLQTLLTGLSSTGAKNKGGGYMGQLADAKARLAQGAAEEEQSKVKLTMSEKELVNLEARMKVFAKEAGDNLKKLEALKATVQACQAKVTNSGWSVEKDKQLDMQLREARETVKNLHDQRERVKHRIGRLNFDYDDPVPGFDRRKVKGVAAQLISLPEEHYPKAVALEIAGGGKLFNVVIENELVGKDLIKNGNMKKRVTFIPLSKIDPRTVDPKKLNAATKLAPGKVRAALSLVGYEGEVAKAIAYVFGDTLICDDAETAKLVTFADAVRTRSVTLDGDIYDPSGTLSGGSAPNSTRILIQVQELLEIESKLRDAQMHLSTLEKEEQKSRNMRNSWRDLARDLEIKEHELKLLEEQVGGSNASLNASEVEKAKATIEDLRLAVKAAKEKQKDAQDDCKKLERDMDEFKNNKDGKIEELKASISKQKSALQKHSVIVKTQQKELQTATLELEQNDGDIEGEKESLEEAKAGLAKLHKELDKLGDEVAASEAEHATAEEKLQEEMATLSRFDQELKELDRVIKEKKGIVTKADLSIQEFLHDIQVLNKEKTSAANKVASLEAAYEWIAQDKDQFGSPGTQYDWGDKNITDLDHKVKELEENQRGMKRKINPKVMNMIDKVEKKEADLKKNIATVEKDKVKIDETIESIDRHKRDALQTTWEKVNKDFGEIFAELLPGNFAKLQPPDGQDLMDGLEVKVQLGTVWKQSLTELSGGQRSLIALSLIMSLLQFKPAPMYILDEIDAALDLSHTQHIGQLFRTRFKGSQFIVVSLKEGLFTNANVLFRAKFRDGTSIVERTAQRSTSSLYANGDKDANEDDGHPRRTRR